MTSKNHSFLFSLLAIFSLFSGHEAKYDVVSTMFGVAGAVALSDSPTSDTFAAGGEWVLLQKNIGISAMHMQLLKNNKVVIFDRTDFGITQLSLPHGRCRQNDAAVAVDCSAHSILYDPFANSFRALTVQTDVWCSSGAVNPNGTLIQTGGYLAGDRKIRLFSPCSDDSPDCDWLELPANLTVRRWYSSNQILPDGRVIVVGGRGQFSYEFFPKNPNFALFSLQFLNDTTDRFEENNLYPFLHLLPDGNLFVFANRRSISLNYTSNRIVKKFPIIPGEKRNYPSTGSSVLLPIRLTGGTGSLENSPEVEAEVMICGGARGGSFIKAQKFRVYVEASRTCGRLRVTDSVPEWVMEEMPMSRVMPDMLILPSGDILIMNGASNGTAGWEDAIGPVLNPVLYNPTEINSVQRFTVLNPTSVPRMYHSAATLLPDGRVLVGGSNPHQKYVFNGTAYPTDLSLEAFLPPYMGIDNSILRPSILSVEVEDQTLSYGGEFVITFSVGLYSQDRKITVAMVLPSFTTHSFAMNQRLLMLEVISIERLSLFGYKVTVYAPPNKNVAPPGYYMLFVVNNGIPGQSLWIHIK